MTRTFLNLSVVALLSVCSAATCAAKTIILVRHAERVSPDGDNALSEKGRERAKVLAEALQQTDLTAIFVSQMIRTKETADPVAQLKKLPPEAVPTTQLDALVERLKKADAASVILVVHHSGTIPQIVQKLGGGPIAAIPESEFDRMVIVNLPGDGKASVLTLRYGVR